MITQKLYKSGNSVAVTIPVEFLKELKLSEDSEVVVKRKGEDIVITSKRRELASDVDPKFMKMVDEFINEHKDVLQELSKR